MNPDEGATPRRLDGEPHEGLESELLIIELETASGIWQAYGLYMRGGEAEWLDDPVPSHVDVDPVSAFGYWREKDHNGISYAVFGYWVRSRAAAESRLAIRRAELAEGATPFTEIQIHSIFDLADSEPSTEIPQSLTAAVVDDTEEPEVEPVVEHRECESRALPQATALALVWRLAAELVRRYPERLWVQSEGGGMYDRTTVFDLSSGHPQVVTIFNALGSGQWIGEHNRRWTDAYKADADRAQWLTDVAREAGLPPRGHGLPPSTPASLVARWVAAFLALQVGARRDWLAAPPAHFPDAARAMPGLGAWQRENEELSTAVVCLTERGAEAPQLALSISGDLWRDDGRHFQLTAVHSPGAPATAMLVNTVLDLLP